MDKRARKFLSAIVVMSFLHAAVFCGACAVKRIAYGAGSPRSVVCYDVCGKGAPSGVTQGFDIPFTLSPTIEIFFQQFVRKTPTPEQAVASADTGEVEKPPKTA